MDVGRATKQLIAFVFGGGLGRVNPAGKLLSCSFLPNYSEGTSFVFIAAWEEEDSPSVVPIQRYRINIDKTSGKVASCELIALTSEEIHRLILDATGQRVSTYSRFTDGAISISYKISVMEDPETSYILQLRHYGDTPSINTLMRLVSSSIDHSILPVPTCFPSKEYIIRGMGVQITQFIPGVMGNTAYPRASHEQKLVFVTRLAKAFDALWSIPIPGERLIGEIKASGDPVALSVAPYIYHLLGGPFPSVAEYLRAFIHSQFQHLEEDDDIEAYKSVYFERISKFVKAGMPNVPTVVEQIPVVFLHSDMGLNNIVVSSSDPTSIEAIIDWEFCTNGPYCSLHSAIENLFRESSMNGFGKEYPNAGELREAFWGAIPRWKEWNESEAGQTFLEWFRFGIFLKARGKPDDLGAAEKEEYWAENERVVETFLEKYDK
jgi:hypothetical protein